MSRKTGLLTGLVSLIVVVLAACSGGGGGGGTTQNATALTVADKVSVVDAKLTNTVAAKPLLMAAAVPVDSDYNKDETNVYVHERSVEMFGIINEILCMIGQTKYDEMLNTGPYTAQIDVNQCSSARGDAAQAGQESSNQSSGATAPDYELWTVESSRADDNSPQILKAWVHQEADEWEPAQIISAKVVITEGKSASNPYGIFTINFIAHLADNPSIVTFRGVLKSERDPVDSSKILLKFVDGTPPNAPDPRSEAVTLSKNADGTSGAGSCYRNETWYDNGTPVNQEFRFDIAYNADFFLRKDALNVGAPSVCLDRNNFEMSAWRYALYDSATGTRVNRNSGFPIKKDNAYGYVGYWGLWLPEGVVINSGDTVNKHDYQTNTDTPFTIFKAAGKLKKHTRKNLTLADVKSIPLDYWDNGTNYRVMWDGTNFNKIAQMPSNCTSNCMWSDIPQPYPTIDFGRVQWSELNFWSQSLGGQVRVPLSGCSWTDPDGTGPEPGYTSCSAPTNTTAVVFFQEDIVYPTDTVPASLVCYDNCLKAGTTGIDPMDPNHPTWDPMTGQSLSHSYAFNTSTMLLTDGGNAVVSSTTSSFNQWGYMSGALVDPNTPNLTTLLDCNWDMDNDAATNPQACGWKAWSAFDVFYTWETGPNNWNHFTAVKDSGGRFVKFDPPLHVEYTHSQTNSALRDFKYNGTKFNLEYAGFGELHGIPGKCVDMDTGLDIDCAQGGQGRPVRWVPEFFISAASEVTAQVNNSTVTYVVKPLEMEQRMIQSAGCAGAGLVTQSFALPLISEWTDPAVGAEPTITAPPAVIGGVVQ